VKVLKIDKPRVRNFGLPSLIVMKEMLACRIYTHVIEVNRREFNLTNLLDSSKDK